MMPPLARTISSVTTVLAAELKKTIVGNLLRRVLRSLPTSANWSRLAHEFGHHDQAHFIAEFRELVGTTPNRFVKSRDDAALLRAPRSRW